MRCIRSANAAHRATATAWRHPANLNNADQDAGCLAGLGLPAKPARMALPPPSIDAPAQFSNRVKRRAQRPRRADAKKPPEGGLHIAFRRLGAAARTRQVLGVDSSSSRAWAANPLEDLLCSRRIRKGRRVVLIRRHDDRLARSALQTCVSAGSDSDHAILGGSNGLNILRCGSSSGARFASPLVSCREGSCRIRLDDFRDASAALRSSQNCFRNFGADRVILICRQCHSSQDTNDRHNDHQFDQGETLLHIACDRTTVHSLTPGWFVEPGNQPGARNLPQHPCHPVSPPCSPRSDRLWSQDGYMM